MYNVVVFSHRRNATTTLKHISTTNTWNPLRVTVLENFVHIGKSVRATSKNVFEMMTQASVRQAKAAKELKLPKICFKYEALSTKFLSQMVDENLGRHDDKNIIFVQR